MKTLGKRSFKFMTDFGKILTNPARIFKETTFLHESLEKYIFFKIFDQYLQE